MASSRSRRTAQKTSSKRSATRRPKKAGTTKKKAKGRPTKASRSTKKKTTSRGSKAPAASAKRRTARSGTKKVKSSKSKRPAAPSKPRLGDARLDRRILDGMLHDREGLMRDMNELGYTMDDVVSRAADLGLSEALIRQVRGVAADLAGDKPAEQQEAVETLAPRTCLSCDRVFLSNGPGNRLCMRCRGGDAGLAGV